MRIEYEKTDVLQNIEAIVSGYYEEHPDLTDYAVLQVYEALIRGYTAEKKDREPRPWELTEDERILFEHVKEMCEYRLGRNHEEADDAGQPLPQMPGIDLETMLQCLKRLRKSIQMWTRLGGPQGYLNYMSQFMQ